MEWWVFCGRCVRQLSGWRGRHVRRRACQTVLASLLEGLLQVLAPVVPHMAEDAWQCLPYPRAHASVFQVCGESGRGVRLSLDSVPGWKIAARNAAAGAQMTQLTAHDTTQEAACVIGP
jgi:isoleucyl-tRNA synthetase